MVQPERDILELLKFELTKNSGSQLRLSAKSPAGCSFGSNDTPNCRSKPAAIDHRGSGRNRSRESRLQLARVTARRKVGVA